MSSLQSTAALSLISIAASALATPFHPSNLLISTDGVLYEVNDGGSVIQSIGIPSFGEAARDIAVDYLGRVHVFNGTFDPVLSTYDPVTTTWEHRQSISGWSTVNNGSYGGIGAFGSFVFLTDMATFGDADDPLMGLIRYDTSSDRHVRFATDVAPIDLTVGHDGLIYALYPGGSPEGRFVRAYDPLSLELVKSMSLSSIFGHTGHRSLAVDGSGALFIADWDGEIHRVSSGGVLEKTIARGSSYYDIDLRSDGAIALGNRGGGVILTDASLNQVRSFSRGNRGAFVAFAELGAVPEPNGILLSAMACMMFITLRGRLDRSSVCRL